MKNNDFDFMESFYEVIDSPIENSNDDGVIYVGEEEGEDFLSDFEESWGDDITFVGDEEDEDQFFTDLGEGYIPLPQGEEVEYETIVIDEHYVLDEYETDFAGEILNESEDDDEEVLKSVIECDDCKKTDDGFFEQIDSAESVIKFPETKSLDEELFMEDVDPLDDRISKQIAKDFIQDTESAVELLPGDELEDPEEDNSLVNGDDLFGNDIDVIIAEDPGKEIEDEDFVEGSFKDWAANNIETTL